MGGWRRRWPRPVGALALVLALAAGCTVRARPEPAATSRTARPVAAATSTTAGPAVRGATVAARAFTLVRAGPGGPVRPAGSGPLPVALRQVGESDVEGINLLLVFPLLKARPRCVRQVELWLRVLRHQPRFHIAAYPSGLVSLASDRPTTRAGSVVLIDIRPRGEATVTADRAWMHFDVTELYRTWAEGGPFPPPSSAPSSRGRRWWWTSGRTASPSRTSRSASPRSTGTPTPRRSCAGRRPGIAEPSPVAASTSRTTTTSSQRPTAAPRPAGKVPARGGTAWRKADECSSCRG